MGEKGNDLAAAAPSVIERTTTVITDTTGEVGTAIKDKAIDAVAEGTIAAAAGGRLRKKDEDDNSDGDDAPAR